MAGREQSRSGGEERGQQARQDQTWMRLGDGRRQPGPVWGKSRTGRQAAGRKGGKGFLFLIFPRWKGIGSRPGGGAARESHGKAGATCVQGGTKGLSSQKVRKKSGVSQSREGREPGDENPFSYPILRPEYGSPPHPPFVGETMEGREPSLDRRKSHTKVYLSSPILPDPFDSTFWAEAIYMFLFRPLLAWLPPTKDSGQCCPSPTPSRVQSL